MQLQRPCNGLQLATSTFFVIYGCCNTSFAVMRATGSTVIILSIRSCKNNQVASACYCNCCEQQAPRPGSRRHLAVGGDLFVLRLAAVVLPLPATFDQQPSGRETTGHHGAEAAVIASAAAVCRCLCRPAGCRQDHLTTPPPSHCSSLSERRGCQQNGRGHDHLEELLDVVMLHRVEAAQHGVQHLRGSSR